MESQNKLEPITNIIPLESLVKFFYPQCEGKQVYISANNNTIYVLSDDISTITPVCEYALFGNKIEFISIKTKYVECVGMWDGKHTLHCIIAKIGKKKVHHTIFVKTDGDQFYRYDDNDINHYHDDDVEYDIYTNEGIAIAEECGKDEEVFYTDENSRIARMVNNEGDEMTEFSYFENGSIHSITEYFIFESDPELYMSTMYNTCGIKILEKYADNDEESTLYNAYGQILDIFKSDKLVDITFNADGNVLSYERSRSGRHSIRISCEYDSEGHLTTQYVIETGFQPIIDRWDYSQKNTIHYTHSINDNIVNSVILKFDDNGRLDSWNIFGEQDPIIKNPNEINDNM